MTSPESLTIESALRIAERAIKNRDFHVARSALVWVLKNDRRNVPAKLLYAHITENREAKIALYSQVLELDPDNETARKAITKYGPATMPKGPWATERSVEDTPEQPLPTTELEVIT